MAKTFDQYSDLDLLLGSGIFDRHWYAAQSDRYFSSWHAAAEDFLAFGMSKEMSPHPLMDVRSWPGHLRAAWKDGKLGPVLNWFRRPLEGQPSLGPLLVPRMLNTSGHVISSRDVASHAGGTLGWLLEHAPGDYVVDFPEGHWVWENVLSSKSKIVATIKTQTYKSRPRMKDQWNKPAEDVWRGKVKSISLPSSDNGEPLVSIIMPAWNRADVIAKAIRSVQRQTADFWELIVVDDGSTDATREVVRLLASSDSRISLLSAEHGGVCAARNLGLNHATGRWVSFLDTDNEWPEEYLELSIKGAIESNAQAVYAGLELHNGGKVSYRAYQGALDELMIVNHIDLNVLTVERTLAVEAGGFDEGLKRWVDHDFAIRIAKLSVPRLLPFIGCKYWDDREAETRITTSESDSWQWVVLGKNLVDWPAMEERASVPGRVTISMPVYQDWLMTVRAVRSVLDRSGSVDIEVVVVDNGSAYHYSVVLGLLLESDPRVKYVRLPRNMNFAVGSNYGAYLGTGEFTCFLNNDTIVRDGWLEPLLERLQNPEVLAVQPLLQYPDDSIQTAGTVFMAENRLPGHFLANHPPEDAATVADSEFSAITGACMLWRTKDVASLRGFDPFFVNGMEDIDLCLRAIEQNGGYFAVDPRSKVTHHESKTPGRGRNIVSNRSAFMKRWAGRLPSPETDKYVRAGFELAHVGGDNNFIPSPRPIVTRAKQPENQRWGIRLASTGGANGDKWGDTHYVNSLADALRGVDCEVVTYRHGHNVDRDQVYDDVNLVIRGLDKISPIPGTVNVLWVISHPEDVSVEEVQAFDLVYASSLSWSAEMTELSGREVKPLLQATDSSRFHLPAPGTDDRSRPTTFVGANTHNRDRKVVSDALVSGIDLRIIGHGWADVLEPRMHEAEGIKNELLGDFYRSSKRVLADHWTDMAEQGFIQNRIFDAIACGTPVVSDQVSGLTDVFGSMVQVYESLDELRWLCSPEGLTAFGTGEERAAQARQVLEQHSFEARAKTLTQDVREWLLRRNLKSAVYKV
ncbi:glycosyltransferase [Paeniglutamicibacter sp. ABSL32-1]|uniref:glycosyltransferase n=1 Tax=Paeniglutamicibacter quisquiliarum TaxID=2849498 RepID=UPI001C2CF810|nr:glycosyltransferase [Paeniglutamicibacter quisquiliarum]MBV1780722.1 glycosyltransferase [Paeniglutamicibacter quisquiliarum]